MASTPEAGPINGIDVVGLREYIDAVAADPSLADRNPVAVARWVGGTRAEVSSALGGPPVYMGGDDDPSAMGMLVRTLAACDVEVVATTCSLLGVEIEALTVEVAGYFNVRRYLGLAADDGPGLQQASYTIRLKTRGATAEQLAAVRRACLEGSPVGDTFERRVRGEMKFEAE